MLSFSLVRSGQLLEEIVDLTFDLQLLFVHRTKSRNEQQHMLSARFNHARSNVKSFSGESLSDLLSGFESYNASAATLQQRADFCDTEASREIGRRSLFQQIPQPTVVVDAPGREYLGKVSLHLFARLPSQRPRRFRTGRAGNSCLSIGCWILTRRSQRVERRTTKGPPAHKPSIERLTQRRTTSGRGSA
jgi:hypothetical protein